MIVPSARSLSLVRYHDVDLSRSRFQTPDAIEIGDEWESEEKLTTHKCDLSCLVDDHNLCSNSKAVGFPD